MPQQNKNSNKRKTYPTDLTDKQWAIIAPLLPPAKSSQKKGGRQRTTDMREILNAIFYFLRTGCSWRMIPHDFPDYHSVRHYFDVWKKKGIWKKIHDTLRTKVRLKAGKKAQPTAAIIDSQSVKTTEKGGFVAMTLVKR
jgi:putative transposase